MKRLLLIVPVIIICMIFLSNRRTEDTIILGTMSGIPPYVSINTEGAYEGFDIAIAQEIAKRLGKKLIIQDMDTVALITALNQGRVDFLMTSLDITPERQRQIAMISYQGEPITHKALVFWQQIPAEITSLADIKQTVCVEAGSSSAAVLEEYPQIQLKYIDPLPSLLELKYGKAQAAFMDKELYLQGKKQYPELCTLMIPLGEKHTILGIGIGVKKTNTGLRTTIENLIQEFKQTGLLKKLQERWLEAS